MKMKLRECTVCSCGEVVAFGVVVAVWGRSSVDASAKMLSIWLLLA